MAFGLYAAKPSTNFHENCCNMYIIYTLQDIRSVLRRQSRDTNRTDRQTNKQTNKQTKVLIDGNDNGD